MRNCNGLYGDSKCPGYLAEFLGTAVLVIMGVGTTILAGSAVGYLGIAFSFGLTLMALVYVLGPASGCHVNPAVTLAMFLMKKMNGKIAVGFIISQLLGGIFGAFLVYMVARGKADFSLANGFASNGFGSHSPGGYTMGSVLLAEIVMTTVFLMVVLAVTHGADHRKNHGGHGGVGGGAHGGIVIGGALTAIVLVLLPVSGASFNFARSLATAVFERGWALEQLWVFAIAQGIAAILATLIYRTMMCVYHDRYHVSELKCQEGKYNSCCCVDCQCENCKCSCHDVQCEEKGAGKIGAKKGKIKEGDVTPPSS